MIIYSDVLTKILKNIQLRIDTTNYFLDQPKFDYQPLPWAGINSAGVRGDSTYKRWSSIKKSIRPYDKTLKDIGCCVGYFCVSASKYFGITSVGVDSNEKFLRIARNSLPETLVGKCNYLNLLIDEHSVSILPTTDITLCLSIWHHWVYKYGLKKSTKILQKLWLTTNRVLFFESGEEEVQSEFKLPYSNKTSAANWLENYLADSLEGAKIIKLGKYLAGSYAHYLIKNKKRTLFMVVRSKV